MSEHRSMVFRTCRGWAGAAVSDEGVRSIVLPKRTRAAVLQDLRTAVGGPGGAAGMNTPAGTDLKRVVRAIQRFFSGLPAAIDLPLDLRGATEFQRSVWQAARAIPCGETRSYGWLARRIGRPKASRAVGQAMGANPVPVLVP